MAGVAVAAALPLAGWALLRFYFCPAPSIYRPPGQQPRWPLLAACDDDDDDDDSDDHGGSGGGGGGETVRCVHINVWSGSTYELLPAGASWPVHLLRGRFGSYETAGQAAERFALLVTELTGLSA